MSGEVLPSRRHGGEVGGLALRRSGESVGRGGVKEVVEPAKVGALREPWHVETCFDMSYKAAGHHQSCALWDGRISENTTRAEIDTLIPGSPAKRGLSRLLAADAPTKASGPREVEQPLFAHPICTTTGS